MQVSRKFQIRLPWVLVGALLACAIITGFGFALGDPAVAITAAVIVVLCGLGLMVLPRLGLSDRVSFAVDFPNSTRGPRGAVHDGPTTPVESDPKHRLYKDFPRFRTMDEVHTGDLPEGPDDQPAWPQYVNLAPGQHVRMVGGREVIERDPDPEDEPDQQRRS